MATNVYFSQRVRSEQNLYEDIVIESLKMYGQDVYYLPRDIVNEDSIFGEDIPSRFNSSHKIEMYIENTEGFDGEGDLFTRFGVEIRDEATLVVSRRRWVQQVSRKDNELNSARPREGDLIYIPLSGSLFEITHVEHEQPFYQLSNLPVFKMRCHLFEYNDEDFDTGVQAIQNIEKEHAYQYILTLGEDGAITIGGTASQTLSSGVVISGEVQKYSDSDNKMHLSHVGADDGLFHTFVTSETILVDGVSRTVIAVTEDNQISENEQNNDFSPSGLSFLDFSEDNPFGDPELN